MQALQGGERAKPNGRQPARQRIAQSEHGYGGGEEQGTEDPGGRNPGKREPRRPEQAQQHGLEEPPGRWDGVGRAGLVGVAQHVREAVGDSQQREGRRPQQEAGHRFRGSSRGRERERSRELKNERAGEDARGAKHHADGVEGQRRQGGESHPLRVVEIRPQQGVQPEDRNQGADRLAHSPRRGQRGKADAPDPGRGGEGGGHPAGMNRQIQRYPCEGGQAAAQEPDLADGQEFARGRARAQDHPTRAGEGQNHPGPFGAAQNVCRRQGQQRAEGHKTQEGQNDSGGAQNVGAEAPVQNPGVAEEDGGEEEGVPARGGVGRPDGQGQQEGGDGDAEGATHRDAHQTRGRGAQQQRAHQTEAQRERPSVESRAESEHQKGEALEEQRTVEHRRARMAAGGQCGQTERDRAEDEREDPVVIGIEQIKRRGRVREEGGVVGGEAEGASFHRKGRAGAEEGVAEQEPVSEQEGAAGPELAGRQARAPHEHAGLVVAPEPERAVTGGHADPGEAAPLMTPEQVDGDAAE